ncbi:MAG TPA: DNA-directed RNA polymerase subunit omega [Thermotogota bacterium]|nr:DNA-directed RNA polymerase subunit omega [Thermotogota bacterium]HRW92159.1 DNA-directed RNA polymerase subunit omega [Thermotogota bacterium]
MYKISFNYDRLLERIPYKYAIPVLIGKRAERLKEETSLRGEHVELASLVEKSIDQISQGKVKIKNEDMMKLLKPVVK